MPESRSATRAIPIAVIAVLLLALQFYSPPRIGLWANVFYDSLHVPVFGLIAISLYNIFSRRLNWPRSLIAAFFVACILGVLSETAQIATSRDASWRDIVSNCLGAAGFLAIYVTLWPPHPTSGIKRFLNAGVGALILGVALAPLIHVSAAYAERNLQQPVIANFDGMFGRLLIRIQNADYQVVPASGGEPTFARITLGSGPWPGIAFHDLWPDWTQNEALILSIAIEGQEALDLHLRVHDLKHRENKTFPDRFSRSFNLAPGDHELRIALSDLRDAPRGRAMNLAEMDEMIIFSDASHSGRSFRIYGIHLE
jgi:hypothetical protein